MFLVVHLVLEVADVATSDARGIDMMILMSVARNLEYLEFAQFDDFGRWSCIV